MLFRSEYDLEIHEQLASCSDSGRLPQAEIAEKTMCLLIAIVVNSATDGDRTWHRDPYIQRNHSRS